MKINLNNDFDLINNLIDINIINTEIGNIICIDDFLRYPNIFYNFFDKDVFIDSDYKSTYYPGKEINLNDTLKIEFDDFTDKYIKPYLDLNNLNKIIHSDYTFRLINKKNSDLIMENMLPHNHIPYIINNKDNFYYNGISSCLYLYNKNNISNGTSIYKEKIKIKGGLLKKKLEYVNNKPVYDNKTLNYENYKNECEYLKKILKNPMYNADNENILFKKIFSIDAKFNRIIFFPNNFFHNFDIDNQYYNNINDMDNKRYTIVGMSFYDNKFKINNQYLEYILNK